MDCPMCGGRGCRRCRAGKIEITGCPILKVEPETWEIIKFTRLYEKGLPPVAGGALDQAKGFIDAAGFIFAEERYWKKKLGIKD